MKPSSNTGIITSSRLDREVRQLMIVHSVSLENFKSIGCYPENEVLIEPNITAIIGKNECGKSNILEGLSQINFLRRNNAAFSDDKKTGSPLQQDLLDI